MAATADQIRIIRNAIPDTEEVFGPSENETMFSDDELQDFFTLGSSSTLRAIAHASMAIGSSEALISKIIRTQDLQTNGAQLAESFYKRADRLFDQADKEDEKLNSEFFEIIDYRQGWRTDRPELTEFEWA